MVTDKNVILVDVGNTRFKYCLLSDAENEPVATENLSDLLSFIDKQQNISHLYLASVRKADAVEQIFTACEQRNIVVVEKNTEREAFGIKNSYENEKKWGSIDGLPWFVRQKNHKKHFL